MIYGSLPNKAYTKRTQKIQLTKSKNTIKKKNDEIANIKEKNQKLKISLNF